MDPFKNDPSVLRLEAQKRRDANANWRDQRKAYASGERTPENVGPCLDCGSDQLVRDDFVWVCAECDSVRLVPMGRTS